MCYFSLKYTWLLSMVIVFTISETSAQTKLIDRQGKASFFSEAPVENIEAHSNEAMSVLDLANGEIVATIKMKSFEFKKSLMQEHFNENYAESEKFPNAIFRGRIRDFDQTDFTKEGKILVDISGELSIHGVTQLLECTAEFEKKGTNLNGTTSFPIKVADFDIDIPKIVFYNIAEIVEVKIAFSYQPLNP